MLTLYTKPGCPYCAKVREEGKLLGITFDERSIRDPGVSEELVEKGGKLAVPYLIDDETGKSMYGSDVIVTYLHERFTQGSVG
ncbi:MAG: hypothetical protein QOE22_186 [Candidatus Parcubacteria bacterium]|jgi:glutaredoxin|nr:hypothetical protein [Candidatus Parcubacteria bacterium]